MFVKVFEAVQAKKISIERMLAEIRQAPLSCNYRRACVNFHLGGLGNFASRTSDSAADIPKKKILEGGGAK
jgi:hypothetical protein